MQRENENAMQVQDNLEREVTGGVSSFSMLRMVLSFLAVAYDLMRRLSTNDIQFLGKSENGKALLRFATTIQKMVKDDGLYLWRDIDLGTEVPEITLETVPAGILDQIRQECHDEFMENLNWDELTPEMQNEITEGLTEQIKPDILDEAASAARQAVSDNLGYMEDFYPDDVNDSINKASSAIESAREKVRAIRDSIADDFALISDHLDGIGGPLADAYDNMPSDGVCWSDVADDLGIEVETAIERS